MCCLWGRGLLRTSDGWWMSSSSVSSEIHRVEVKGSRGGGTRWILGSFVTLQPNQPVLSASASSSASIHPFLLPYGLPLLDHSYLFCLFLLINLFFHASSSFFLLTFAFPPTLYLPTSLFLLSSSFSTSSSLSLHPPPSPFCGWFLPCGGCNSLRDRWAGAAIIPSPAAFDGSPSSAVGVILRASGC